MSWIYASPRRAAAIGRLGASVAAIVLFAGTIGWAARRMASTVKKDGPMSLAELFGIPQVTWLVPETIAGALVWLLVFAAGFWLKLTAEKLQRLV